MDATVVFPYFSCNAFLQHQAFFCRLEIPTTALGSMMMMKVLTTSSITSNHHFDTGSCGHGGRPAVSWSDPMACARCRIQYENRRPFLDCLLQMVCCGSSCHPGSDNDNIIMTWIWFCPIGWCGCWRWHRCVYCLDKGSNPIQKDPKRKRISWKNEQSHATIMRCHRPRSKEKRNQASSRGIKSRGTHQNRQRSYIQISFGVTVSSRTPGLTTSLSPSLLSHGIFYKPELDCVKSFRKRSWSWPS